MPVIASTNGYYNCGTELERVRYEGSLFTASYVQDEAIAAAGIGMVGWFTNQYIIDFAGLVNQTSELKFPSPYFYNSLIWTVMERKPKYIFDAFAVETGWPAVVKQQYRVVGSLSHCLTYYTPFMLWERIIP